MAYMCQTLRSKEEGRNRNRTPEYLKISITRYSVRTRKELRLKDDDTYQSRSRSKSPIVLISSSMTKSWSLKNGESP